MSKENLEQFLEEVAQSEELQAKIGDEIEADSLIALAAEYGCEFTEGDLQESAELSEEELSAVTGGAWRRNTLKICVPSKKPKQGIRHLSVCYGCTNVSRGSAEDWNRGAGS